MDFTDVTVLCIGDLMLDRFVHGKIERISPEAPIPILHLTRTQEMLGGAGNVGHNIASLGGRALLVGLVGTDALADTVRRLAAGIPGSSRASCRRRTARPSARPGSSPRNSRSSAPTRKAGCRCSRGRSRTCWRPWRTSCRRPPP